MGSYRWNAALFHLRKSAFLALETVKHSEIRNAYRMLKEYESISFDSQKFVAYQTKQLQVLLDHAVTTVPYYRDRKPEGQELRCFPVVNKVQIRAHQEDFLSDRYEKKELVTMSTSGSTGTPFICYQDSRKKKRVHAEVIYFSEKAGYEVGRNLIYLRALTQKCHKPKWLQWLQNEELLDISNLDDMRIKKLLYHIEKASCNGGSTMLGYASTFDAFRDYFRKQNITRLPRSNVVGIISSSEILFDDTRQTLSQVYQCPCVSRYANQENGILGQDEIGKPNVFILNEMNYYFEVLQYDKDEPVEEEEVGRIVVTDLYNYAMPMIRYDTGDIGAMIHVSVGGVKKRAIHNFGGRKVDIVYDCFGNRLSPHMITNHFWAFPEITQFQFVQLDKTRYLVKVNMEGEFTRREEMITLLQSLLGENAIITINMVNEIPVLASGKRKYIENRMLI